MVTCSQRDCAATCGSDKWARIRAVSEGWFFRKDGTEQWCPSHLPSWVQQWRANRRKKVGNDAPK